MERPGGRRFEGCRRGLCKWCQAGTGLFSLHRPATPAMRRNLRAGKKKKKTHNKNPVLVQPPYFTDEEILLACTESLSVGMGVRDSVSRRQGGMVSEARVRPVWLEMQVW